MFYLYLILQAFFGIALFYLGSHNPRKFLYWAAFLIPLQGLTIQFFVNLSWYKLIFPIGILAYMFYRNRKSNPKIPGRNWGVLFVAYVVILTTISGWLDSYNSIYETIGRSLGWGIAQTTFRYPVQLTSFIFIWGTIFLSYMYATDSDDVQAVVNGYINGVIFSISVGFYQVIALTAGLPWINIGVSGGLLDSSLVSRTTYYLGNLQLNRLFGLGGEPKHAASYAVLALALLLSFDLSRSIIKIEHPFLKFSLLTAGLVLTTSTGGWIALGITFIYFTLTGIFSGQLKRISKYFIILVPPIIVVSMTWRQVANQFVYERTYERFTYGSTWLESIFRYEPKDAAFIEYATENISNLILGHGVGGLDARLVPYAPETFLAYGGTITPAYLATRLFGEIGLVGLLLIIVIWLIWFSNIRRNGQGEYINFMLSGTLILLVATQVSLAGFLFILGGILKETVLNAPTTSRNTIRVQTSTISPVTTNDW